MQKICIGNEGESKGYSNILGFDTYDTLFILPEDRKEGGLELHLKPSDILILTNLRTI